MANLTAWLPETSACARLEAVQAERDAPADELTERRVRVATQQEFEDMFPTRKGVRRGS